MLHPDVRFRYDLERNVVLNNGGGNENAGIPPGTLAGILTLTCLKRVKEHSD